MSDANRVGFGHRWDPCRAEMVQRRRTIAVSEPIGSSASFMAVLENVENSGTIELRGTHPGEAGTGKEVMARARSHQASPRRQPLPV